MTDINESLLVSFNGESLEVSAVLIDAAAVDRLVKVLEANKGLLPKKDETGTQERETIQTLLDLLNPLHGSLDEQTYDERVKQNMPIRLTHTNAETH